MLNVALIEPFYEGSHKTFCNQLLKYSSHNLNLFSLPGSYWKWRMRTSAITLAREVNNSNNNFDVFFVSDFLNLSLFKNLLNLKYRDSKFIIYFHENQLTYPWSKNFRNKKQERRELGFININSAIVSDRVIFNSKYHKEIFIKEAKNVFSEAFDYLEVEEIDKIDKKSEVVSPGVDYESLSLKGDKPKSDLPIILWNHRFEFDKNPEEFFSVLRDIKSEGYKFKLNVLGEVPEVVPNLYKEVKLEFKDEIINFGYLNRAEYIRVLQESHILPVTSIHDFFGISVVEAMTAGIFPLLPNRLAYPEHLAGSFRDKCIYENMVELKEKLKELIQDFKNLNYIGVLESIKKYEMQEEIKKYDFLISKIIYRKSKK